MPKMVTRYDTFKKLDGVEVLPTGFLRIPIFAARTGIQLYRDKEGNVLREYRPKEEVFSAKTMSSLRNAPFTNDHPDEMVSPKNARQLMVGFTGDTVENVDDQYLKTHVVVTDEATIELIQDGKVEVSMGYDVELDETPGEYEGEHYDMVQRNIVCNHMSLVDRARGGPEVRLRLDSDAFLVEDGNNRRKGEMPKIKIGKKEFEADQALVDAVTALQGELESAQKNDSAKALADLKVEHEKLQAKADAATDELEKLKKDGKKDGMTDTRVSELVRERRKLERVALRVLPKEDAAKIEDMSDADIRKAVITAECPDLKLDGKSDVYVQARFDHIAETLDASEDELEDAGEAVSGKRKKDGESAREDADEETEKARKKAMERDSAAWQKPVGKGAKSE